MWVAIINFSPEGLQTISAFAGNLVKYPGISALLSVRGDEFGFSVLKRKSLLLVYNGFSLGGICPKAFWTRIVFKESTRSFVRILLFILSPKKFCTRSRRLPSGLKTVLGILEVAGRVISLCFCIFIRSKSTTSPSSAVTSTERLLL